MTDKAEKLEALVMETRLDERMEKPVPVQVSVQCSACGWQFNARPGQVKVKCENEACAKDLVVVTKGASIDTSRAEA